ncbi:hypothetical protein MHU86_8787 [Fragilaria crotonensis]|nr:hypothetical protein MHU86_8787 [Fragilaria crotonensis]
MSEHYRPLSKASGSSKGSNSGDTEHGVVLSGFGGVSCNCKKSRHKANKRPAIAKGDQGTGGRFQGKYNNCGNVDHRKADCWEKEVWINGQLGTRLR